jgi:hypothetical protein
MSFSLHAAQTKVGQLYYFGLFGVTLPMFYLFVTRWYVPALALPRIYVYLAIVAILGQLVAIIVPAVDGLKEKIHDTGAYLMTFALAPLTALLVLSAAPAAIKVLAIVGTLYMVSSVVLFFALKTTRARYLFYQAVYVAVFHLIILVSTYTI